MTVFLSSRMWRSLVSPSPVGMTSIDMRDWGSIFSAFLLTG